MLQIYHVPGTRSVRPLWLCYELGLDCRVEFVEASPQHLVSAEWLALSPAGKIPVLVDGPVAMFESGAMVDYILEHRGDGRLLPRRDPAEYAAYRQWCWFAEATLIRPLGLFRLLKGRTGTADDLVADAEDKFFRSLQALEGALADGRPFLLGERFTGADVMMGYSVALLARLLDGRFPSTVAYHQRLVARPAHRQVQALSPADT